MKQLECVTLCLPCSLMVVEKVCLLNYFCCPQNIRCYIYVKSCYYQQSDTNDNLLSFLMLELFSLFYVIVKVACTIKCISSLSNELQIKRIIGSEQNYNHHILL